MAEEEEEWRAMPAGLQQLLLDLAGNVLSRLTDSLLDDVERYAGYFSWEGAGWRADDEGRYWRVRMRVLTAIANCRSLYYIRLSPQWKIGLEREEEVLVLLRGWASNPVLSYLNVDDCEGFGRQAACVALRQLLASSPRLGQLSLARVGLKAAGLGVLAEALSGLEYLHLGCNEVGDAEGAQHVALVLATAPRLKRLRLEDIGMDVAGARLIANALPLCATLRFLGLGPGKVEHSSPGGLGPVSTVLKLALTHGDENGSVAGITELGLWVEKDGEAGLEDALREMLRTNTCLRILSTTPPASMCKCRQPSFGEGERPSCAK